MNATDNNPYGNGTSFPTVEAGINYHADRYLSWGYTDPIDDARYFGAHVGNKGSGMNVKYASDPFWGEKIAGWYYRFDNTNGLKDYNSNVLFASHDHQFVQTVANRIIRVNDDGSIFDRSMSYDEFLEKFAE